MQPAQLGDPSGLGKHSFSSSVAAKPHMYVLLKEIDTRLTSNSPRLKHFDQRTARVSIPMGRAVRVQEDGGVEQARPHS